MLLSVSAYAQPGPEPPDTAFALQEELPVIPGLTPEQVAALSPRERQLLLQIEPPKIWERQPGETATQYAAFCVYRDLGPRRTLTESIRLWSTPNKPRAQNKVLRLPDGTTRDMRTRNSSVLEWSQRHNWKVRAQLWDQHQDREAQQAEIDHLRALKRREARMADRGWDVVERAMADISPAELRPKDLSTLMMALARLGRMAHDQPDSTVAHTGNVTHEHLVHLSDEELDDRLRALLSRSRGDLARIEPVPAGRALGSGADRGPADTGAEGPAETAAFTVHRP